MDETIVAPEPAVRPYPRRWAAAVVLVLAFLVDLMSISSVTVALPSIRHGLRAGPTELEWIPAAYLLAFAVSLVTAARLGDRYGRKRVFLVSLGLFGLAGIGCGLAPTAGVLVAARVVQGLAAAGLTPQVLSTVYAIFDERERAAVLGVWGFVAGLSQAVGVLVGGLLVSADLAGTGWRPVFLVTVPVAAVLVVAGARLVPETRDRGAVLPRPAAVLALTVGLAAVVVPLLEGTRLHWPAWTWFCLAAGVLVVVAVAVVEARLEAKIDAGIDVGTARPGRGASTRSLLPVDLLRRRGVAAGLLVQLAAFGAYGGLVLVLSLWMQDGLGWSPLRTGAVTVAFCGGSLVATPFVARLTSRFGRLVVAAGCLLFALGALALLPAAAATPGTGVAAVLPALVLLGAGLNLVMPPLATLYLSAVPPEHVASASGILTTGQQFAGALGVAALGSVWFAGLGTAGAGAGMAAVALGVAGAAAVGAGLTFGLRRAVVPSMRH